MLLRLLRSNYLAFNVTIYFTYNSGTWEKFDWIQIYEACNIKYVSSHLVTLKVDEDREVDLLNFANNVKTKTLKPELRCETGVKTNSFVVQFTILNDSTPKRGPLTFTYTIYDE